MIRWLLADRKYHHPEVDYAVRLISPSYLGFDTLLQEKSYAEVQPFRSPVIALILRASFLDQKAGQDQLLVDHLRKTERVPLTLIALTVALVCIFTPSI